MFSPSACSIAGWLFIPALLIAGCSPSEPDELATEPEAVAEDPPPVAPDADPARALHDAAAAVIDAGSVVATTDVEHFDDTTMFGKLQVIEEVIIGVESAVGVFVAGSEPLVRMIFVEDSDTVYVTNGEIERQVDYGMWLEEDRAMVEQLVDEVALAELDHLPPVLEVAFRGEITRQLLDAVQDTDEVTVLGRDVVRGSPATRYLARLEIEGLGDEVVQTEVWVGDDGYLHRLEMLLAASSQTALSVDVLLSDHGRLPGSLLPDPDFVTSAQALDDQARAFEDAADDRTGALEASGFSQDEIAELAGERLSGRGTSLFWHPDGQQLCEAQRWEGFDAEIEGYADGEWTLECVDPRIALERYCAGAVRAREGMPYEPYDWQVIADGLDEMSLGWNDGPYIEDYDDPLNTQAWMLDSAANIARDRSVGSLDDSDLQGWLDAELRAQLQAADRLCG